MSVRALVLTVTALTASMSLLAQDRAQQQYGAAYDAWDAGHYPEALTGFQRLLSTPDGERFVESIALLTGELYRSIEVVPSDRFTVDLVNAPKWSPDGRHFAFESIAGGRTSRIYRVEKSASILVATLDGYAVSFAFSDSRVAFLRIVEDEELKAARAAAGGPGSSASVRNLEAAKVAVVERDLTSGRETVLSPPDGLRRLSVHYASDNQLFVTAGPPPESNAVQRSDIYTLRPTGALELLITSGQAAIPAIPIQRALAGGRLLVGFGRGFAIVNPADKTVRSFAASAYSASAGGEDVVFQTTRRVEQPGPVVPLAPAGPTPSPQSIDQNSIQLVNVSSALPPKEVTVTPLRVANPVISPNGRLVAFQVMPREDWELSVVDVDRKGETRITNEIQHDHTPRFLSDRQLLGVMGENRHRRSYVYDVDTGRRTRLFHNNGLRTLAMEHSWAVSPDGSRVIIVADRDGDTISPERGVYVMDLTTKVGTPEVLERLARMLSEENDLRERGRRMFAAIAPDVRDVVREASVTRVYGYERDLVAFGSKYMTQPGNKLAADYIFNTLQSFGYEPQYQYFEVPVQRDQPPLRTANVIATLRGTANPELEYLISSHYDSVLGSPGADDDTSGSAALLEAARILRGRPMPATIKFIWFTGEEAGLLGSREYVRQAVAAGHRVVGALNNDMVGFAGDNRLDDTIRYSNVGLRDLQHAAAFLFTNLVTYDAKYYQGTDAASYFAQYGDIVAGIGSHPILGSPHYHQPHDVLETVNIPLITEVAKTTVASIMLMASSPMRLTAVTAAVKGAGAEVTWPPSPEKNVAAYLVRHWVNGQPRDLRVSAPRAAVPNVRAGEAVWVKAVNARGMEGWDWQRATVK